MNIDDNLIESLLYGEESDELDFKSEQYLFNKASITEKSKLLKDILAFANSWCLSDAFILIGVLEVKGGRSKVLGISDLLDDAKIQQFVNFKVNHPIRFSYRNISFEGKTIAVIHIPLQQRPFYLKKDYGKLKKKDVYVKRGSSTDIASLEEISKMGISPQIEYRNPELEFFFANPKTRTRLTNEQKIRSLVLDTPKESIIPDYERERDNRPEWISMKTKSNRNYYKELVHYTRITNLVSPLYGAIENSGECVAQDVRIEIKIKKNRGNVIAVDSYEYPTLPESEYDMFNFRPRILERTPTSYEFEVVDIGDSWIIEARAEKVQPKAIYWFQDSFYLGSKQSSEVPLNITIFSDDLNVPKTQKMIVIVQAEQRKVDLKEIIKLEDERFRSSPEFQRYIRTKEDDEE